MSLEVFAKQFKSALKEITNHRRSFDIFHDFVYSTSYQIEYSVTRSADITDKLDAIKKKYSEEEYSKFKGLFELLVSFQTQEYNDYLGYLYCFGGFFNKVSGQYFTPPSLTSLMCALHLTELESQLKSKDILSLSDPTCGSGSIFIEQFKQILGIGFNPQKKVYFYGQDIDPLVARMCYLQLSIIGAKAEITIGDTLNVKDSMDFRKLYTPMTVFNA